MKTIWILLCRDRLSVSYSWNEWKVWSNLFYYHERPSGSEIAGECYQRRAFEYKRVETEA